MLESSSAQLTELNDQELLRYSRQIMLPKFDVEGQLALKNSCVLIIGLGGLGSPVSLYLAAAGVGRLVLVDNDEVDVSNLQRQIVHDEHNVGMSKVESAAESLRRLNPNVTIETQAARLEGEDLLRAVYRVD